MNRLLPYLQLMRLPNVFTAMADICLAALAVGALPEHILPFILLLIASSALYCSGMVWNDYCDVGQDERERPFRPLPSGRVSMHNARILAGGLMLVGLLFALLAGVISEPSSWRPAIIALCLCAAILLYDGWAKRTWLGPPIMGLCRFLNVVLGLCIIPYWIGTMGVVLALVVGIYITGVTLFARTEARESNRIMLAAAMAIMLAGLLLSLALPTLAPIERDADSNLPVSYPVWLGQLLYPYLLLAFAIYVGVPSFDAWRKPAPERVQKAVKRAVLGLVILDAILATIFVGPAGLLLLFLLAPALRLGRWIYST